jgi:predicted dehydrogenase
MKKYNWGIIGCGKIAHKFAQDLALVENGELYAVASRSQEKSNDFGNQYQAQKCYGSYQDLANDPNVDVVYIATPHPFHCEQTLMCLEANKAVLCEKAFGMNKGEVEKMVSTAREKGLFLMEALWTRFIPGTLKVLELIESGQIGDLQTVKADFGFQAEYDVSKRLFNKKLGGGSLLDIGIYPIFLSLLTIGKPKNIQASAVFSPTQVDSSLAMIFEYENNQTGILDSTLLASTPIEGWIFGSAGAIKMNRRFHHCEHIELYDAKFELVEEFHIKYEGNGYYHEIEEVHNCLNVGKLESDKMPLSFSLDLIETLDRVREVIGLEYE